MSQNKESICFILSSILIQTAFALIIVVFLNSFFYLVMSQQLSCLNKECVTTTSHPRNPPPKLQTELFLCLNSKFDTNLHQSTNESLTWDWFPFLFRETHTKYALTCNAKKKNNHLIFVKLQLATSSDYNPFLIR